ncbi:diguanylate cyclase, partial [Duganella sp. FT3S]
FLACLYVGTSMVRLYYQKRQLEDQVAQQLQNISVSMKRSLALQLAQLHTDQKMIADQINDHFPADLARAEVRHVRSLQKMLTDEAANNDDIALLGVADVDGKVLYMSNNVRDVRAGDQIDVAPLRADPSLDTAISIYRGGVRSAWPSGFLVLHPVRYADGRLHAFVFALQSHDSFHRRLEEQERDGFSLGEHRVVAIIDTLGDRLAFRDPPATSVVGERVPEAQRTRFRHQKQLNYWVSPYDQIRHLVYEQPLVDGRYLLRVEAAERDYLAPWYKELAYSGVSAVLLLVTVMLLLRMVRQSARQTVQLHHDKKQLEIGARTMAHLIATAPVALAQVRQSDGMLLHANIAFENLFGAMPGDRLRTAAALFTQPSVWDELSASAEQSDALNGRGMELTLAAGARVRHALVSVAMLPFTQGESRELLISFTDIEAQHEREQALTDIAYTDPLTRLANRRAFLQQAGAAFAGARRHQRPLALLMIDLDHFKHVNDTYGHAAGDAVLVRTANCMRDSVRRADFPARLGGEEFVVLLPDTGLDDAFEAAERLRRMIEQAPPAEFDGHVITVTASIGVALMQADSKDIASLLHEADLALYRAKETGRNRVALAGTGTAQVAGSAGSNAPPATQLAPASAVTDKLSP